MHQSLENIISVLILVENNFPHIKTDEKRQYAAQLNYVSLYDYIFLIFKILNNAKMKLHILHWI